MLYRSTDRLSRCGAPVKNLSHSASFESFDKNAPLKSGTKHLALLIGPEFDEFLCAPIGADRNGTGLSVLSALARLNVDPWQEATSLARMPREAAVVRFDRID
jgi:hypothetical protein